MAATPEHEAGANLISGTEAPSAPNAEAAPLGGATRTLDGFPHDGEQPPDSGPHSEPLRTSDQTQEGRRRPSTPTPLTDLHFLAELKSRNHLFGKLGEQEAVLVFEGLHLENIHEHEVELFRRARKEPSYGATSQLADKEIHELLHNYRQAIDDFEFFRRLPKSTFVNPSKDINEIKRRLQEDYDIFIVGIGQERIRRAKENFQKLFQFSLYTATQLGFATLGGLFLIVPLIIMVYVPGRTASVVTTCTSVFLLALTLAVWSLLSRVLELGLISLNGLELGRFEPKDILGAAAAYAAVLAIFVGASISSH